MPEIIPPPIQRGKGLTQNQKILTLMCRGSKDRWFFPYDHMRPELGELFVGYVVQSRLTELQRDYPQMFEKEVDGKYTKRRLNRDDIHIWFPTLPKDLRQVVAKELNYYPYKPVED
ncbi:hypothetical protein [Polynucleobacter sp.]|uniref:hypothetical protein n=1 Tax=Polynucleobacter sp. TaxID=2029855 RepID=UPI003F69C01A